jgi:hypothetical protein
LRVKLDFREVKKRYGGGKKNLPRLKIEAN